MLGVVFDGVDGGGGPNVAGAETAQHEAQLEKAEGLFKESGLKGMSREHRELMEG